MSIVAAELSGLRKSISGLTARRELCQSEVGRFQREADQFYSSVVEMEQVLKLLQGFADRLQTVVQEDVSKFVSDGLKAVFGDEKDYKLEFGLRNNQVVANMTLNDLPLNDTAGVFSQSGGVLHVVSWLLRLWVVLRLSQLGLVDRVIFMDEPFGWVSPEYLSKVTELMVNLSRSLGVQHIYITREPLLIEGSDLSYVITKNDGEVVATRAGEEG